MSVGNQNTKANMDNNLTSASIGLRALMEQIRNLNNQVNGSGQGLAYLESIGYSSAANASNPGGVSDAQYALTLIGYMWNVAGCYYGTVQQGGSGGTGAILFNFETGLSTLWAGN